MSSTPDTSTQLTALNTSNSNGPGQIAFPSDHGQTSNNWITFIEFDYRRPISAFNSSPTPTGGSFSLPTPPSLNASYQATWGDVTETAMETTLVDNLVKNLPSQSGKNLLQNPAASIASAYKKFTAPTEKDEHGQKTSRLDALKHHGIELGDEFSKAMITDVASRSPVIDSAAAVVGLARNPWNALTFTGMEFRSWSFSWRFFPKSFDESQKLEQIIKMVKKGMHPSYAPGTNNNVYIYPNMYLPVLSPNQWLFDFGFCVVTNFDVNYHGGDGPLYFYHEGQKIPAQVNIRLAIKEIEINTKESFDSSSLQAGGSAATQNQILPGATFRGR
jgi:hypothetical protein